MPVTIDGTNGITNGGGYTGDGVSFADATPANTLVTTTGGNVGIGTSSPLGAAGYGWLTVNGSSDSAMSFSGGNTEGFRLQYDSGTAMYVNTIANIPMLFKTNDTERMRIDSAGNVGIGTSSPGAARVLIRGQGATSATLGMYVENSSAANSFSVRDDRAVQMLGVATVWTTGSSANVYMDTNGFLYRFTSSERYKENITDTTRGLTDVLKLRAVTYTGKAKHDGDTVFGGMIAEEVHEAGLTEFVMYDDEGRPDALHYAPMVSLAFKAIQEQQAIIEDLRARLAAVEGAIA